ncbi:MAG: hypothetical protein JW774_10590 [Candidatus Aureabacteria bacterium]|nr:hypothetical protein [Candidatus Auribacterota bacterium]
MNNALTLLLIVVVLAGAAVYSSTHRYQVIQDPQHGTLLMDSWDVMHSRIIEKKSDGSWVAIDVVKGGPSVISFETDMRGSEDKKADTKPLI